MLAGDLYKLETTPITSSGSAQIAAISLPPGKWLLTGHVVADNTSSTAAADADCIIGTVGFNPLTGGAKTYLPAHSGSEQPQTLDLQAISDSSSSGTAELDCAELIYSGPAITYSFGTLTATKATNVTQG